MSLTEKCHKEENDYSVWWKCWGCEGVWKTKLHGKVFQGREEKKGAGYIVMSQFTGGENCSEVRK